MFHSSIKKIIILSYGRGISLPMPKLPMYFYRWKWTDQPKDQILLANTMKDLKTSLEISLLCGRNSFFHCCSDLTDFFCSSLLRLKGFTSTDEHFKEGYRSKRKGRGPTYFDSSTCNSPSLQAAAALAAILCAMMVDSWYTLGLLQWLVSNDCYNYAAQVVKKVCAFQAVCYPKFRPLKPQSHMHSNK